ncbi:MAG TPA: aspartate-semialdehyde dehydrogenase [Actinomycetota bacterium]|nr:aspartate-semialdehyde dehydrogenase [Actinomycetota bacterium]
MPPNVAVVGATGAVGTEMLRILAERAFPLASLRLIATARSAGRKISYEGEELTVAEISERALEGIDVALFDTPDEAAIEWIPKARTSGAICIDNSAAWRMDDEVPLIIPEINAGAIDRHRGIVANPNCTAVTLLMPLAPLHRAAGCTRVIASSYQSVSGAGVAGVEDLYEQTEKLLPERDAVRRGRIEGSVPLGRAFAHPIAFNVIPHVGSFDPAGTTSEERRVAGETRKILDAPIEVFSTCVRVPTVAGHGVAAWAEFARPIDADEARALLSVADGVTLDDDPKASRYPTILSAAGGDKAVVGRVRSDPDHAVAVAFFSTCDNLRKGAALNAVQIAELLVARGLI